MGVLDPPVTSEISDWCTDLAFEDRPTLFSIIQKLLLESWAVTMPQRDTPSIRKSTHEKQSPSVRPEPAEAQHLLHGAKMKTPRLRAATEALVVQVQKVFRLRTPA